MDIPLNLPKEGCLAIISKKTQVQNGKLHEERARLTRVGRKAGVLHGERRDAPHTRPIASYTPQRLFPGESIPEVVRFPTIGLRTSSE